MIEQALTPQQLEKEVPPSRRLQPRRIRRSRRGLKQGVLVHRALWRLMDVLVHPGVLDGAVGGESPVRLDVLADDERHENGDRRLTTRGPIPRRGYRSML